MRSATSREGRLNPPEGEILDTLRDGRGREHHARTVSSSSESEARAAQTSRTAPGRGRTRDRSPPRAAVTKGDKLAAGPRPPGRLLSGKLSF
jgi:hypothetical protein